jgi:hypothetical protein
MFHLANKVYITTDKLIDPSVDRVVISKNSGFAMPDLDSRIGGGQLIAYGTTTDAIYSYHETIFALITRLIEHNNSTGFPVVIYADDEAFFEIMVTWYKTILKNENRTIIENLIKFQIFRFKTFYRSEYSSNSGLDTNDDLFDINKLTDYYYLVDLPSLDIYTEFMNLYRDRLDVELLLASYLTDGSHKEELKTSIKPLIKKDLEKYLDELKEIFWTHIMTNRFTDVIGVPEKNIDNISNILGSTNKWVQLFTRPSLWRTPYLVSISSEKNNVKWDNLNDEDIADLKEFVVLSGQTWNEEKGYEMVKSDIGKLDFLSVLTDDTISDEMLNNIINTEATFYHAAGSFFSLDLETVNNWLITELLQKRDDASFVSKYALN